MAYPFPEEMNGLARIGEAVAAGHPGGDGL